MKQIALALSLCLLALSSVAEAQDPPGTGHYFLVGTESDHLLWRAVGDAVLYDYFEGTYCFRRWMMGVPTTHCGEMDPTCFAAPYTGSCGTVPSTGTAIPHAWPLLRTYGEPVALCISFGAIGINALYAQQTRVLDVGEVTIPDLTPYESIPQACKQDLILETCGPLEEPWAATLCDWGYTFCCGGA